MNFCKCAFLFYACLLNTICCICTVLGVWSYLRFIQTFGHLEWPLIAALTVLKLKLLFNQIMLKY